MDLLLNLTLDNLVEFWIGSNFPEMYFFLKGTFKISYSSDLYSGQCLAFT